MDDKILVIISTYNGQDYFRELLDSVLAQTNVSFDIFIRDDGSTDATIDIIKEYSKKYDNIFYEFGNNLGYVKSFWKSIQEHPGYDYYAFCDQDDIWKPEKLSSSISLIKQELTGEEKPILYTSRVISINNQHEVLSENQFNTNGVINVFESFQKSIVPGCVFVFNKQARDILSMYNGYMESHDWAAYSIISAFGKVIYDKNSYILYRIHEGNTIGVSNPFKTFSDRLVRFFSKKTNGRSKFAMDFYKTYQNMDFEPEVKQEIYNLGFYLESKSLKKQLLESRNFSGLVFKIYVLLNRV